LDLRRTGWRNQQLTQLALSRALGVSVPLVSSWENGKSVPPPERLDAYARLVAAGRATPDGKPVIPASGDLTTAEHDVYERLLAELVELRRPTDRPVQFRLDQPDSPLLFPPGETITIVCPALTAGERNRIPHTDNTDPDYVNSYRYGDLDSLIDLLLYFTEVNRGNPVKLRVRADLQPADRATHLILLGGTDVNPLTEYFLPFFDHIPLSQRKRETEADTGAFTVWTAAGHMTIQPRVELADGVAGLREDVALFLRAPNPYNHARTLTLFNGMYARGTLGVVQALTDPSIRTRNAEYVSERFRRHDTYSILCRVPVVANEIVIPDWTLADIRLHEWPEASE
jgi:transcriptional regulator with XRE-family HTH domain